MFPIFHMPPTVQLTHCVSAMPVPALDPGSGIGTEAWRKRNVEFEKSWLESLTNILHSLLT